MNWVPLYHAALFTILVPPLLAVCLVGVPLLPEDRARLSSLVVLTAWCGLWLMFLATGWRFF